MTIELEAIGTVHSPFTERRGMPIQPAAAVGVAGTVEVFEEYRPGLQDLEGFSHIVLLYHFHRSEGFELQVVPYLDTEKRGVFATRAPRRPCPIGLSVVRLRGVDGAVLRIENVDILDGTPLLDIKPHVPDLDAAAEVEIGWLARARDRMSDQTADDRFT
jgi:tRNA-Thr(GGU) m(6)t(6)A37 methyltransferase TsaA